MTESAPSRTTTLQAITSGPHGALWFTDSGNYHIERGHHRRVTALIVVLVRPAALPHSKGRVLRQRSHLHAPRRHLTRASTQAARRDAWIAQAQQTLGLIGF